MAVAYHKKSTVNVNRYSCLSACDSEGFVTTVLTCLMGSYNDEDLQGR
jgi:hypothetical protein